MLATVARPEFTASLHSIYETDKATGKLLLSMRDERGQPAAEVVVPDGKIKPTRLVINKPDEPTWGLESEGDE
jgi:hypothetical protein